MYSLIKKLNFLPLLLAMSCTPALDSYEDKTIQSGKVKIIAHKGGGIAPFSTYPENSLEACIYGLTILDGIEIDVQKSRAGTLWLYHDEFFAECDGRNKARIAGEWDSQIEKHMACNGISITRLEEVFKYHSDHNLTKRISLDIKSWLPTLHSFSPQYLNSLADELISLVKKYNMEQHVMIECESAVFLDRIKLICPRMECYLTIFGDLKKGAERALKAGYDGLSFRYDSGNPPRHEDILKVKRKGLKIQFWTINDKAEIEKAILLEPDFIQTDNIKVE